MCEGERFLWKHYGSESSRYQNGFIATHAEREHVCARSQAGEQGCQVG
jgi:hypothetical protein